MNSTCPAPFLDESLYPGDGGATLLRYCLPYGNASCCLPCPSDSWRWPNAYHLIAQKNASAWLSTGSLILLGFQFLSIIVLPKEATERHYLTTLPLIGFTSILLYFAIPLSVSPDQCYDPITANTNKTDLACGATSAFLFFGSWTVLISCFFRALSLHLLVCWEVRPGRRMFIISTLTTLGGSAGLLVLCLLVCGAAYQWGNICYLIPRFDHAAFWGPVLAVTIASLIVQLGTMGYCVRTIVQPLINDGRKAHLPPDGGSNSIDQRALSAKQASLRIKIILSMQWRPTLIVTLILGYVVFLSSVLMQLRPFSDYPRSLTNAWFACLARTAGDKTECHPIINKVSPTEPEILAVVFMFALTGVLAFTVLNRWSLFTGWVGFFRSKSHLVCGSVQRTSRSRRLACDDGREEIEIGRYRVSSSRYSTVDSEAAWSRDVKHMT